MTMMRVPACLAAAASAWASSWRSSRTAPSVAIIMTFGQPGAGLAASSAWAVGMPRCRCVGGTAGSGAIWSCRMAESTEGLSVVSDWRSLPVSLTLAMPTK